jgi:hypothetical protein
MLSGRLQNTLYISMLYAALFLLGSCPKDASNGSAGSQAIQGKPAGTAAYQGPFKLEVFPLDHDSLLGPERILTSEMNTFAGLDHAVEGGQVSKIQFMPKSIEAIMNVPLKLDGRKSVAMFFPDRRVLVTMRPLAAEAPSVMVIDTESGMELDVTPSNLGSLWDGSSELPLIGWTGKHGLSLYAAGKRADELVIWQGHNGMVEVQRLPTIVAIGSRMTEDGRQFLAVSAAMELMAFNEISGQLEADPDGIDLAAAIADEAGTAQGKPLQFAAAQGLAVLATRDGSHWSILGDADQQDYIEVHDAAGVTPEGRRRIPGPADLLGGTEAQRLRSEAAQQPAWFINDGFVVPLNPWSVGVFDLVYQRLVVVSLPN